jgi:hypothetical protein
MLSSFSRAEKKLWLLWILAAVVGRALPVLVAEFITDQIALTNSSQLFYAIFFIFLAIPRILIQWWALRPHIAHAWWWIPATLGGSAMSTYVEGIAQWALLRRRVKRAFWWPLLIFLLSYLSQLFLVNLGSQWVTLLPLWLLDGAISGWLMVILLRQPWQPEDGHEFDQMIKAMEELQKARGSG